jgi:CheY-like chemotaxis protein
MKDKRLHKVLLVDDDEVTNFLNEDIIREMDFAEEVKVARNGKEALNYIEQTCNPATEAKTVDLILLDINMPVMDGFEFLQHFNAMPARQGSKIIILTTSDNYRDMQRAEKYNIQGYINKPLSKEKINRILSELFDTKKKAVAEEDNIL